jgi:peptidoglycan hydrolase CwlO-like protein
MENFLPFSVTCHGAKYKDKEMPCQDASTHTNSEGRAMAIVADGHGSTRCFRSHVGSKKVVEIAETCFRSWLSSHETIDKDPESFKDELHGVIKQIINRWFAEVMEHESENPLSKDPKLEEVAEKYKDRYTDTENPANIDYRCHAYGTTLMMTAITDEYWFAFQVGDGKCVVLYEDGTWSLPIPWDDNCTFNTTTSICDDNSLEKFRYWFGWKSENGNYEEYGRGVEGQGKDTENKEAKRPLAIFIGTDGVEDSYPRIENDKYVRNFYRNRIITRAEGNFETFKEEINGFAERFAERESTDDVSIAGIIGDFSDKADMVAEMKLESANHETGELLTVKKRDAVEKSDALDLLKKQSGTKFDTQKQLEEKIVVLGEEIELLVAKKKSLEISLEKAKSEANESERMLGKLQNEVRVLEGKIKELTNDERMFNDKITIAEIESKKTQGNVERLQNEFERTRNKFREKSTKYNELSHRLSTTKSATTENEPVTECNAPQNGIPIGIYNSKGQVTHLFTLPAMFVPVFIGEDSDTKLSRKLEALGDAIIELDKTLRSLKSQTEASKQINDIKCIELDKLRSELIVSKQHSFQAESELTLVRQNYRNAAVQNQQHRNTVKQYEQEIEQLRKQLPAKHAEIDKLKPEAETLKEQNKVQSDRIATLEAAYEKAKKEVEELENKIKTNAN